MANPSFTVAVASQSFTVTSSGTLSGGFSMTGSLSSGTYNFSSSGSPLTSPAFTTGIGSFSNLPDMRKPATAPEGAVLGDR